MEDLQDWKMGSHLSQLSNCITPRPYVHILFRQHNLQASWFAMLFSLWNQGMAVLTSFLDVLCLIHTQDFIQFKESFQTLLPFTFLSHSLKTCSLHYQRDSHITSIQFYVMSSLDFPAGPSLWCENLDSVNSFGIASFVCLFPQWILVQLSVDISIVLMAQRRGDTGICRLHPSGESGCCSLRCLRCQRCWQYVTYKRGYPHPKMCASYYSSPTQQSCGESPRAVMGIWFQLKSPQFADE